MPIITESQDKWISTIYRDKCEQTQTLTLTHTHTYTDIYPLNSVMNVNNELGNIICYVVSRLWPWEHGRIQCSNEMTNIENWKRITQRERRKTRQQQMHKKKQMEITREKSMWFDVDKLANKLQCIICKCTFVTIQEICNSSW